MRYVWPIATIVTVVFCLWVVVVGFEHNALTPLRLLIVALGAIVSYFMVVVIEIYWRDDK